MGDDHPLGAGGGNGPLQARPVGVVAEHEAAVHALAAAGAAQLHPAAGKAVAEITQLARPGAGMHRRRRHHQGAAQGLGTGRAGGQIGQQAGVGQRHAGVAVGGIDRLHRAVHHDGPDRRVHPRQQPLRLAEAVGHQQAGQARGGVGAPPGVDIGQHLGLRPPAVDGQAEGGFGDEAMAAHRLEWQAGGVALVVRADEVVARGHPHLAGMLHPHLGRPQHMAGRVQADAHTLVHHRLAIGQALQVQGRAQAAAQHAGADGGGQHMAVAGTGMVGMGMGDHRAVHRAPGVDVEVTRCAVQALRAQGNQVVHGISSARSTPPAAGTSARPRPRSRAAGPPTNRPMPAGASPRGHPGSRLRPAAPARR